MHHNSQSECVQQFDGLGNGAMVLLPRYKLRVGSQLRYRLSAGLADHATESQTHSSFCVDWDFHVVARHANGYSRVIFSECRTQDSGPRSGKPTLRRLDRDGFFDIDDSGRLVENWTITPLTDPSPIFPQLPEDQSQFESGWTSALELDGAIRDYTPAGSDTALHQSVWHFVEVCRTQLDPIYLASRRREHVFDLDRGLVNRVTTEFERGWPAGGNPASSNSIELIEAIEPSGPPSCALAEEAERYFEVSAEYQRLIDLAQWDLPQADFWQNKSADVLERFVPTVGFELIQKWLQRKLKLHNDECENMLSDAQQLARLIDTPALDWQSVDLSGETRRLRDYRGQVLLLCFWNRGCPWSIRALLTLRTLAAEMHQLPVAFLGVNADRNLETASIVWRALNIAFPTILDDDNGHTMSPAFGIDGYPTTVLIDQSGVIRRIRPGYSCGLASTLALEMKRLVNERP